MGGTTASIRDTPVQSNYTATKSRLSKGTMGEVDRRSCKSQLSSRSGGNRQLIIINLINRSAVSPAINGVGDRYICDTTMYYCKDTYSVRETPE